jgi:hypothetical protein
VVTVTAYEDELRVALAAAAVPMVALRLPCTLAVEMPSPAAWMTAVNITPPGGGEGGMGGGESPPDAGQLHPAVHTPLHVGAVLVQSHWCVLVL